MVQLPSFLGGIGRSGPKYTLLAAPRTYKRSLRFIFVTAAFFCILLLFSTRPPKYHEPFQYEYSEPDIVTNHPKPWLTAKLEPFPDSPMLKAPTPDDKNRRAAPWLVAVISGAYEVEQRRLIRSTWWNTFRDVPFHGRFVVSNPGTKWLDTIRHENQTYGDMIVLDHIPEDYVTANTIKSMELLKWLRRMGHQYPFVTKTDTDTFVNARVFYDKYLRPRLSSDGKHAIVNNTVIGQLLYREPHDITYPQGSFYTYSWDMLEMLTELHDERPVVGHEDLSVAVLLIQGHRTANMVNLKGTEQFDFDEPSARGDGSPWGRMSTYHRAERHALGPDAIIVHNLKSLDMYQKVSDCFNEAGILPMPPPAKFEWRLSMPYYYHAFRTAIGVCNWYISRYDFIPQFYFRFDGNDWICDGIWNMGPSKTGEQEQA